MAIRVRVVTAIRVVSEVDPSVVRHWDAEPCDKFPLVGLVGSARVKVARAPRPQCAGGRVVGGG